MVVNGQPSIPIAIAIPILFAIVLTKADSNYFSLFAKIGEIRGWMGEWGVGSGQWELI